ncbi:MAG: glycosyltransferase family 4 protein, partial [Bryobacteraceae bacterium]
MKILWVNSNFMHPTTKGGQIRTLEMLRHLHRRHEIHYVAIKGEPEGPARAGEYSTRNYPVRHEIPAKGKPAFLMQLAKGFFNPVPLAVSRFHPPSLGPFLEDLIQRERFDRAVVDHLAPTAYFPRLDRAVFFQHNVETVIWRRHVEHCSSPVRKIYFKKQADLMFEYERRVCQKAGHIVAVSDVDAGEMKRLFGVTRISAIPTGVNLEYFA